MKKNEENQQKDENQDSRAPLFRWVDENRNSPHFEESLCRLLSFACREWIFRCRGVLLEPNEALSRFVCLTNLEYEVARWCANTTAFAHEIVDFCLKSKTLDLPPQVVVDMPQILDLRGVACPGNAVRSRLVLAGLPENFLLQIWLDEGAPSENVPLALVADGHIVEKREKKEGFWAFSVVKKEPKK